MNKFLIRSIILVAILFLLGTTGFTAVRGYYMNQISKPGDNTSAIAFTVNQGDSVQNVAYNLYKSNIIDNTLIFTLYLKMNNLDTTIEAGKYLIPAKASIAQIAKLLQNGHNTFVVVTIPEGLRIEEIADKLSTQFQENSVSFDKNEFIREAKTPSLFTGYAFIPTNVTTLEGFLFPDTYQFEKNATTTAIINEMLDTFRKKVYDSYLASPNQNSLTFYQDLTLASILEREARTETDKRIIADIMLRRLANNYPLGVDATTQYELGYSTQEQTWWRQTIYQADLERETPYNTRKNPGLPPTPISNPGTISFNAVLFPTANTYYYYISDAQGTIHYAHTLSEQNSNIQKYLY